MADLCEVEYFLLSGDSITQQGAIGTVEGLSKLYSDALGHGSGSITLHNPDGSQVVIPSSAIAYVNIRESVS